VSFRNLFKIKKLFILMDIQEKSNILLSGWLGEC